MPVGTRTRANPLQTVRPPQGSTTIGFTRDVGLSKNVTASCTFSASSGEVSAANGTFAAFSVGDVLLIEGVSLNNGYFDVSRIDAVNHAYLVLVSPPKNEGPLTATIRTA